MEFLLEHLLYLFLAVAAHAYLVVLRCIRHRYPQPPLPPGSFGWPILGETLVIQRLNRSGDPFAFVRQRRQRYNRDIFKTSLLGEKTVVLCGSEGNKLMFTGEKRLLLTWWPPSLKKLFGDAFFTAPYEKAIHTRKLITSFLNQELAIPEEFNVLLKGMFQLPIYFLGTRHYKAVKSAASLRRELIKVIESKRRSGTMNESLSEDLISHLMKGRDENGKMLSDEEIADNVILVMDAGHNTSSSTMMMLIKYLARMEIELQRRPREPLNKDDIQKMTYSWNVVDEVLRLTPPIQGNFRKAIVDFPYAGFSIPKDWKYESLDGSLCFQMK
ncbi:PREDICTED: dammarenediol 12-hydroxylase-like [Nelumbo nucifera]|uniref:Dammarenediol 12-hydroxylase-like n=1 Tax=Nelumbo nucifera TaxID=4432 RepID=A0A1U8A7F1_NELNU|nr:PREDICTED: dammarenediol 12-hydroxylase-like [Nelumbo nucifera]